MHIDEWWQLFCLSLVFTPYCFDVGYMATVVWSLGNTSEVHKVNRSAYIIFCYILFTFIAEEFIQIWIFKICADLQYDIAPFLRQVHIWCKIRNDLQGFSIHLSAIIKPGSVKIKIVCWAFYKIFSCRMLDSGSNNRIGSVAWFTCTWEFAWPVKHLYL